MTPSEAKEWIDVVGYALYVLWPYVVALGLASPLASKQVRAAVTQRIAYATQPKPPKV